MSNIIITDELRDHVNAICAKSKAWAEAAPEGEFRGYCDYDEADILSYCEHYTKGERCLTPEEWDQVQAWEEYYDAYKSENGIRPRWTTWTDHTAEEWDAMSSACYKAARAAYEAEQEEENYTYESPAELSNKIIF